MAASLQAQPFHQPNSAELQLAVARLNVLGRVLYIGAHPDDENTALLAYLAKERLVDAVYLSLTRGDGGQNLIGSEKGELMGVIRTQELLAARRIDGARQFFTRAIDFGYSKSSDESMEIWGHDQVLGDVVRIIRRTQPDVIIARFLEGDNGGHGHHAASAQLAREAFFAAADPGRFPEQLSGLRPWQARRLLWNGWRLDPSEEDSLLQIDIGLYNPLLGRSYTEIAAQSRSMHKSQGFGSAERRGSRIEFFRHLGGEYAARDLLDGIDLSWRRATPSADSLTGFFKEALLRYKPADPAAALPPLLKAWRIIAAEAAAAAPGREGFGSAGQLPGRTDYSYLLQKQKELAEVIRACSGLWLEAAAESPAAAPGESLSVSLQAINRSAVPWRLEKIAHPWDGGESRMPGPLTNNEPREIKVRVLIPSAEPLTQPYWLQVPAQRGLYQVSNPGLIGEPESPPATLAIFTLSLEGHLIDLAVPLLYRWTDPVEGDLYRAFTIGPAVQIHLKEPLLLFPDRAPRPMHLSLRSLAGALQGAIRPALPAGWRCTPDEQPFSFSRKDEELEMAFQITPAAGSENGMVQIRVKTGALELAGTAAEKVREEHGALRIEKKAGDTGSAGGPGKDAPSRPDAGIWQQGHDLLTISYPHIPVQTLYPPAEANLVYVPLPRADRRIGYIMGAGDEIPAALEQMGYPVRLLSDGDLEKGNWGDLQVIIAGVRAYNTRSILRSANKRLLQFVHDGGTLIVQYNTNNRLVLEQFAPWPLRLSRDRVSVEEAPVILLDPAHPLLNRPCKIGPEDFNGWVQERGLYFADQWDDRYQALLSSHDPGEPEKKGGLLHARYGKGTFIFSGYAWFRQLPAGVTGAWRLFTNLIHAGVKK